MTKSFHSNYIKIYLWQGAAFVMRFISLFIVMPYLTKQPSTYGIYAVCISVTFFFGYADLGFLRAGQKYASECFIRNERDEEMKHIGFGAFVLLIFTLLCASVFLYMGYHPQTLIKGLDTPQKVSTASSLLIILAVFAPVTVLQRMGSMIFDIRLESYINQRVSLFASIITIGSVFYFFRSGNYQIVQYFFFSQSVNFIFVIVYLWIAKKKYTYNIKQLFLYVRFDSTIYKKANSLAYSGLYVIIVWILYYELDQIVIAKYLGAEKVAIYATAIAVSTMFRSIFGIFFTPFTVRANYFVGNGDDHGLKNFCLQIVSLSAPIVVLPTVAIAFIAKPFITSWVGIQYIDSIDLVKFFAFVYTLSFITYPISMILIAKERMKEMYIIATIQPLIFWAGVLGTYLFMGLLSFAMFKLISALASVVYYFFILLKFLDISMTEFFKKVIYPIVFPLIFLIVALIFLNNYLPTEKSKINLLIVLSTAGICVSISFFIQYSISRNIRMVAKNLVGSIISKNN